MANDTKERMEFNAAREAIKIAYAHRDDIYYMVQAIESSLSLKINCARAERRTFVPGLEWDAFHLGNAFATADALNVAFRRGRFGGATEAAFQEGPS